MPPRKKARVSRAASPAATSTLKTPPPPPNPSTDAPPDDPWTDEEEIGLFKGLMTWKPTGIHKHFRLLALHHFLLANHYIHPANPHTKPAGIWRKLHALYDLDALDEREDARQLSDLSPEEGGEPGG
ncbi:Chromatin modification-related protein EAF7, partial [Teratosphaeria destructans]